jgi:putative FmdB family regulatory protein
MPIYEFACAACSKVFDELVPMGTTEFTCPECGQTARKSAGSYMFAAHGLENGHIAVGHKLTGKGGKSESDSGGESKAEGKPAGSCGPACACH